MSRVGSRGRINEITRDNKDGLRIRDAIFDFMACDLAPEPGTFDFGDPAMIKGDAA